MSQYFQIKFYNKLHAEKFKKFVEILDVSTIILLKKNA